MGFPSIFLHIVENPFAGDTSLENKRKKNKEKGIIQTDWISVIRMRGTLRWYMRVLLDIRDNKTVVKIYDRVEEPEEVRGKFKNKKGEVKTGWKVSKEKIADANNILKMLSTRLE